MRLKFIFLIFCFISMVSFAESSSLKKIPYRNGITNVDYNGHGQTGVVVSGHRENYNAHSFEVVSFYIKLASGELNIIPIFTEKETFSVTVSGGADCLLHDVRLLRGDSKNPAMLIRADREFGETYVSPETVNFSYYVLSENKSESWGTPTYAFTFSKENKSKQKYCDVGEAFEKELGIKNEQ